MKRDQLADSLCLFRQASQTCSAPSLLLSLATISDTITAQVPVSFFCEQISIPDSEYLVNLQTTLLMASEIEFPTQFLTLLTFLVLATSLLPAHHKS